MRYFKLGMVVVCFVFLCGTKLWADEYSVRGTVKYANGNRAGSLVAKAFQEGLRGTQEMGSSTTDSSGNYRIAYEAESGVTLTVRIFNQSGSQLASSAPLHNAGKNAVVNVTVPNPKPLPAIDIKKLQNPQ